MILRASVLLIAAIALYVAFTTPAKSEPIAATEHGGIRIVLHTEKCAFSEVSNLPQRATWEEGGKVIEGCVGVFGQIGLVLFYFADKTVVAVPMQLFTKVVGA